MPAPFIRQDHADALPAMCRSNITGAPALNGQRVRIDRNLDPVSGDSCIADVHAMPRPADLIGHHHMTQVGMPVAPTNRNQPMASHR